VEKGREKCRERERERERERKGERESNMQMCAIGEANGRKKSTDEKKSRLFGGADLLDLSSAEASSR
jgi:hypothetical protein